MTAPLPAPHSQGLPPGGRNNDKTENHPGVRKGGRLRTSGTGSDASFPELLVEKVSASFGFD